MITVGSTVGNYEVIAKIGSGAMGSVFLAEHPSIGRRVALKVIHSDLAHNAEMVSRFFTEARALTQIANQHIVDVTDFGQTPDGDNFIVMEYLEGHSLGARLKAEPILPVGLALHIAAQCCDGLAASHDRGIIHRDLKPDNVHLIHRDGDSTFVKILDFGLAKLTQGGGPQSHKTQAGSALGTPHYMAPEQCEGRPDIDCRVDIYALGCILYEMLCGRVPFPGEGFGEVLVKHLREPPVPPSQINQKISPAVEHVMLRALEKQRDRRFQTMGELAAALRDPERYRMREQSARTHGVGTSNSLPSDVNAAPTAMLEAPAAATLMAPAPNLGGGQATVVFQAPSVGATTAESAAPVMDEPQGHGSGWMVAAAAFAAVVLAAAAFGIYELAIRKRETSIVIASEPIGALVLREGQAVGKTPVVVKLPAHGAADFLLRLDGFLDTKQRVLADGEPAVVVRLVAAAAPEAPEKPPPERPKPVAPKPVLRPSLAATPDPGDGDLRGAPPERVKPEPKRPKSPPSRKQKPSDADDILRPSF